MSQLDLGEALEKLGTSVPPEQEAVLIPIDSSQKSSEMAFVSPVLEQMGLDPSDLVGHESPDFLLSTEHGTIGIEVTEVHRPPEGNASAAWSGACEAVVEAARRAWAATGMRPVNVNITFKHGVQIPKSSWRAKGREIVKVVESVIDRGDGQYIFGNGPDHLVVSKSCPVGIESVLITLQPGDTHYWGRAWSVGLRSPEPEQLQQLIDAKASRTTAYQSSTSTGEVWLVLGCNWGQASSVFRSDDETLSHVYSSPFQRTLLVGLEFIGNRIDELVVSPHPGGGEEGPAHVV